MTEAVNREELAKILIEELSIEDGEITGIGYSADRIVSALRSAAPAEQGEVVAWFKKYVPNWPADQLASELIAEFPGLLTPPPPPSDAPGDVRCDCQQPEEINGVRLISNSCPIHNENPDPPYPWPEVAAPPRSDAIAWRIRPDDMPALLVGPSITDDKNLVNIWRVAGRVIEPLYTTPPAQSDAGSARVRVAEYICHRFICANDECDGCQPSSVSLEHADTILALARRALSEDRK